MTIGEYLTMPDYFNSVTIAGWLFVDPLHISDCPWKGASKCRKLVFTNLWHLLAS